MANYFVIGNTFRPYSFDELIKPYQMYGEAYNKQEAALGQLETKAAPWKDRLDPELDKEAYDKYAQYTADLEEKTNALLSNGLTPATRRSLIQMTKQYQSSIAPLEEAQTKLDAELAKRAQAGDGVVYQKSDLRIGDFLGGKTPNTTSVDLNKLQARTADKASRLGAALYSDPEWSKVNSQYYQIYTANGIPYDALQLVLSGELESNPNISQELKEKARAFADVANSELNAVEYGKYEKPERAKLQNAVYSGLYAGLAKPTYKYEANRGYETPSQAQARRQNAALFNWQYNASDGVIKGYNPEYLKTTYAQKGYDYDPKTGSITKVGSSTSRGTGSGTTGDIGAQTAGVRVAIGTNPEKYYKTPEEAFDALSKSGGDLSRKARRQLDLSDNVVVTDLSLEGKIRALHNINVSTRDKSEEEIDVLIQMHRPELDTYLYYESLDPENAENNVFISLDRTIKSKIPGVEEIAGTAPSITTEDRNITFKGE